MTLKGVLEGSGLWRKLGQGLKCAGLDDGTPVVECTFYGWQKLLLLMAGPGDAWAHLQQMPTNFLGLCGGEQRQQTVANFCNEFRRLTGGFFKSIGSSHADDRCGPFEQLEKLIRHPLAGLKRLRCLIGETNRTKVTAGQQTFECSRERTHGAQGLPWAAHEGAAVGDGASHRAAPLGVRSAEGCAPSVGANGRGGSPLGEYRLGRIMMNRIATSRRQGQAQAVRRAETSKLGVPTVTDRGGRQAIAPVRAPIFDPSRAVR